jgi:type 1 glutamine amidotransferase
MAPAAPKRILIFSKTKGWNHTSIPAGIAAIQKLGRENNFRVDTTKNANYFNDDSLRHYQAVVWLSTTGNVLNPVQQAAFERYIEAGGGYMGIHAAADTEYDWPWYNKLVGGYFASHPNQSNVRKATVDVLDKNHPSTAHLPDRWERTDEWYNYRSLYSDLHVLANLDENTYEGGINGSNHPIAWYHDFDGGRAYYTGGGHTDESYTEPLFVQHLLGALTWTMSSGKALDYSKAYAVITPEENRFVKTVLVNDLNEPMELAIADDGRTFFTERSGNLSVYDAKTNTHQLVHKFDVITKNGHGVQGITLDPNFATNHFLYVYYAPRFETDPFYNLSRFVVKDDNTLDVASEKILLTVPSIDQPGSHHGGTSPPAIIPIRSPLTVTRPSMPGPTIWLPMRAEQPPIPTISGVKSCVSNHRPTAPIPFPTGISSPKGPRRPGPKFIRWACGIRTGLPSTQRRRPCTGVKLVPTRVKTVRWDRRVTMSLTIPKKPVTSAGHCSSVTASPTPNWISRPMPWALPSTRTRRSTTRPRIRV